MRTVPSALRVAALLLALLVFVFAGSGVSRGVAAGFADADRHGFIYAALIVAAAAVYIGRAVSYAHRTGVTHR
jgi:hypothetical protein